MTVQYAVVAFPNLDHAERIESVRRRFDPLAAALRAHVTLVFPFSDDALVPLLDQHVSQSVAGMSAFDVTLSDPVAADDGYLTVGRFGTVEQIAAASAETQIALPSLGSGRIHEVAVFALDQPRSGAVRFAVPLA